MYYCTGKVFIQIYTVKRQNKKQETTCEQRKVVLGNSRAKNLAMEDSQWSWISNLCGWRNGVGLCLTWKKNIIEGRFPNAKLGVSAHPTFWRTKESQEDLQKGQNVLREISVKENHGTWWWSLFCVLNVVLKMGLKSNFASDQSLSGNLEQKASKHRTRAVDQKNLMLKIYFALPQ